MNGTDFIKIITEEIEKSDILSFVKKDKDFEKRVREIISDTLTDFFRGLYQHNGLFRNIIK